MGVMGITAMVSEHKKGKLFSGRWGDYPKTKQG